MRTLILAFSTSLVRMTSSEIGTLLGTSRLNPRGTGTRSRAGVTQGPRLGPTNPTWGAIELIDRARTPVSPPKGRYAVFLLVALLATVVPGQALPTGCMPTIALRDPC